MSSIGGYSVITLKGEINPGSGHQVEEITRPGVHGVSYRRLGRRGVPFRVQTFVDVSNSSQARNTIMNYKALQGTLVTVIDEHGQTWNNIMCLQALPRQRKFVTGKSGGIVAGNSGYVVTCDWILQATEY